MNHTVAFNRQFIPQLTTCINSVKMTAQEDFNYWQIPPICLANANHFLHPLECGNPADMHQANQLCQTFFTIPQPNPQQPPPVQPPIERNLYVPSIRNITAPSESELTRKETFVNKKLVIRSNNHVLDHTRLEPISTEGPVMHVTYYSHRIFVGSLARETTPVDLAVFFRRFGLVIETKIVNDENGNSKGYGFVTFSNSDPVKTVLSMGSIYMGKKRIAVASAVRKKHQDELES